MLCPDLGIVVWIVPRQPHLVSTTQPKDGGTHAITIFLTANLSIEMAELQHCFPLKMQPFQSNSLQQYDYMYAAPHQI